MQLKNIINIIQSWRLVLENGDQLKNEEDILALGNDLRKVENSLRQYESIQTKDYVDYVYDIVMRDCEALDSVYEDYIERLVGTMGLNALVKHNLVESCGTINRRQLYVICEKKGVH